MKVLWVKDEENSSSLRCILVDAAYKDIYHCGYVTDVTLLEYQGNRIEYFWVSPNRLKQIIAKTDPLPEGWLNKGKTVLRTYTPTTIKNKETEQNV